MKDLVNNQNCLEKGMKVCLLKFDYALLGFAMLSANVDSESGAITMMKR